jgi:hypothetical protein
MAGMRTKRNPLRLLLAGVSLLAVTGCCSTFDQDWDAAPAGALPEGRWKGTWTSEENGHAGGLRCIITRKQDSGFEARYYATYDWCIFGFSFEYSVPMTGERDGEAWKFRGSAELGCWIAGGLYEYEGRVTESQYTATYKSEGDHGVFKLERVR